MKSRGLGRGLSALLGDHLAENIVDEKQFSVHIDLIEPNKYQPRKVFDDTALHELAESIRKNGIIQPIIVCRQPESEKYSIIAGERRWRACRLAGLHEIPIVIKEIEKTERLLEYAIIENIQRQDLTPIEEAESYQRLIDEFKYNQEEVSRILGKSRSHIANILRLNQLPDSVKEKVNSGLLSMGHARSLVGVLNAEEIADEIISNNLNVRQTEKLIQQQKSPTKSPTSKTKSHQRSEYEYSPDDEDIMSIQESISSNLGMKVHIEDTEDGGKVTIYFHNLEQLDTILQKLS
ncbi:MAG: parB [Burkholderiales bacterium]|jgi:ParB family chromosome partitioning protein|nr:parB [Burkholderiales bacterium]